MRMSRKHNNIMVGGVDRRSQQNVVFATLMDLAKLFEAYKACFSTMLYLRVAHTPRSPDLTTFVRTTTKFAPCRRMRAEGYYSYARVHVVPLPLVVLIDGCG